MNKCQFLKSLKQPNAAPWDKVETHLKSSRLGRRLAVAVNCYPLKCKSLERQSDLGVRVRDHPGKRSGPAVVLHTYKIKKKGKKMQ